MPLIPRKKKDFGLLRAATYRGDWPPITLKGFGTTMGAGYLELTEARELARELRAAIRWVKKHSKHVKA